MKKMVAKFVPLNLEETCTWDLEANRTDLKAGRNDRKGAIPYPRRQRRVLLHKLLLLCFLGCGIARFLSLWPASRSLQAASRSLRVASRSHRGLPRGPIVACLKVRAGCLEVQLRVASRSVRVASRSHRGLPRGPREQTLRPKFSILGVFLALLT